MKLIFEVEIVVGDLDIFSEAALEETLVDGVVRESQKRRHW